MSIRMALLTKVTIWVYRRKGWVKAIGLALLAWYSRKTGSFVLPASWDLE